MDHIRPKAKKIEERKIALPNGSVLEINIWQLPISTTERPHGFKYRLQYCLPDTTTLVRYDNKISKGDHKHIREQEFPYRFTAKEQLVRDFLADVVKYGGEL
jgi:hypothetical protein